jgi:hypothetical protein
MPTGAYLTRFVADPTAPVYVWPPPWPQVSDPAMTVTIWRPSGSTFVPLVGGVVDELFTSTTSSYDQAQAGVTSRFFYLYNETDAPVDVLMWLAGVESLTFHYELAFRRQSADTPDSPSWSVPGFNSPSYSAAALAAKDLSSYTRHFADGSYNLLNGFAGQFGATGIYGPTAAAASPAVPTDALEFAMNPGYMVGLAIGQRWVAWASRPAAERVAFESQVSLVLWAKTREGA